MGEVDAEAESVCSLLKLHFLPLNVLLCFTTCSGVSLVLLNLFLSSLDKYTQYADNGTPWKFWYRPTLYTRTDIQTNGHTTMSQNFDIVPLCMSRCHHTVCSSHALIKHNNDCRICGVHVCWHSYPCYFSFPIQLHRIWHCFRADTKQRWGK